MPHPLFQHASGKLFIIASTAINFLLDDIRYNCPRAQMKDLMRGNNSLNILDGIHTQILSAAIPSKSPAANCGSFIPISLRHRYYILSYFKIPLPFDPFINDAMGVLLHLQSIFQIADPKISLVSTIDHSQISLWTRNVV